MNAAAFERVERFAAPLSFGLLGAAASLWLGQDANWDLQNYHLYNAWAVLQGGRLAIDGHPAGEPSFFNPALDLILYPLLMGLPDRVAGALLGAFHGVAAWLVYVLGRELLGRDARGTLLAAIAALAGATSAMAWSELATTFHDFTTAVPILAALLLVLRAPGQASTRTLAVAGVLVGLSVGVKLTNAPYAIGLAVAVGLRYPRQPRATAAFLGCAAAAAVAGHGWWAWWLHAHYASPMFPFLNTYFRSPFYPEVNASHARFFARHALEWLLYPFYFATNHRTAEVAFRDFRLAAAYVAVVVLFAAWALRRLPRPQAGHLAAFAAAAYAAWLVVFSTQRYATTLELLSVLLVFLAIAIVVPKRAQLAVCAAIALALVATTRPADWYRVPWDGHRYAEVWNLDPAIGGKAAILANRPLGSVVAVSGFADTVWVGTAFTDADRARIVARMGERPRMVLAFGWKDRPEARRVMAEYGVGITAPCSKFDAKITGGPVLACPAAAGAVFDPARFVNYTERWSFEARPAASEVRLRRGARRWIELDLVNHGPDPVWSAVPDTMRLSGLPAREDAVGEVNVSYHVLTERGDMHVYDGLRTPLPRSLAPGARLRLSMRIEAPAAPGRYRLQPDVVMEGVRWAGEAARGPGLLLVVD